MGLLSLTHMPDHVGLAPTSIMNGYTGYIYSTAPTIEISKLILTDSAHIQEKETEKYNLTKAGKKSPLYPIYGQRHVELCLERFRGYDYNKPIKLSDEITMWLKPTGHLLGACSIYIEVKSGEESKRILFTGDTSANKELPFTMLPNFKDLKVDYLFTESTYGDKLHKYEDSIQKFADVIQKTCIENKGQLMLPIFSVGRSSTVLAQLYEVYQKHPQFKDIPIYLASPMSCQAHRLYGMNDSFNFYNKSDEKYREVFEWDRVTYIEKYDKVEEKLFNKEPKIIAVSAGMISGGYSVSVACSLLPDKNNTIMFVGYQGIGTNGRNIIESSFGQVINIDNKNVKRKCNVEFVSMSSHADYKQIIDMIKTMRHTKIKKVFLNHGESEVISEFKKHLEKEFKCEIIISEKDKGYNL